MKKLPLTYLAQDLLLVCKNKGILANYDKVREYAYKFKKYNNLTMRQIDAVVKALADIKSN